MERFGYIQINLFAALMLLILHNNSKSKFPFTRNSKRFRKIMILTIIILILDTAIRVMDGQEGEWIYTMIWIVGFLYYALVDLLVFYWVLYVYASIFEDRDPIENKLLILLDSVPLLACVLVLTGWPGLIFRVDEGNHYVKENFYPLQYSIWAIYMIVAACMAFFLRKKAGTREKREEMVYLAYFPILPLAGGIIQLAAGGLATIWPFTVASIVMVYVKMQRAQIFLDPMTGLNNRSRFNQYIQSKMDNDKNKTPWYLLLIDVDDFKKINDSYGHMAGDEALLKMATILKRTFGKMNSFLARYGGDEFVVVLDCKREKDIKYALMMMENFMESENRHDSASYQLNCSAGFVKYDAEIMKTREQLIAAADEKMYIQKKKRKG